MPRHPWPAAAVAVALAFVPALLAFVPAQAVAQTAVQEVVAEVRVHGNYRTPDADVLRIAGLTPGGPLGAGGIEAAAGRLRESGRFDAVDVRKRYRSLTDEAQIAVIIVVSERPGVEKGGVMPGPLKRVRNAIMASPSFEYVDGYGVTAGGRVSFADVLGKTGHVAVPATIGSTRRAALEIDKTLPSGPVRRLQGSAAIASRENPAYGVRDRREEFMLAASRPLGSFLSVNARAGWADVAFGGVRDHVASYGAGLALDTRANPAFPRNAVYLGAAWEALRPDSSKTVNRYTLDARAYAGLIGSTVLALRARSETSDGPLPIYERQLLGGASSLRGFRAGAFTGDNLAAASLELRVPFHSPMHVGQTGLTLFGDVGAAYEHGTPLKEADAHTGVGLGWYVRAPLVQFEIDVARGDDRRTRLHVTAGLRF
jgi:outer membrane protein assembly factor BamA